MGRKGVSKRKPQKSKPVPGVVNSGSSNERSPVHSLVNDRQEQPHKPGGQEESVNRLEQNAKEKMADTVVYKVDFTTVGWSRSDFVAWKPAC
jgi:hypothetical protein